MNYKLQELIDLDQFQELQDRLHRVCTFPSAIIDNDGNFLTATGWQDVCKKFHRENKECLQDCIKSDLYIRSHLHEANPAVTYRCPRGLVDNAMPIIIGGIHYGNFFTGQFFLEKPDLEFFRRQARRFGFDEKAYLGAVERVPIWSQEQLNSYLFFIKELIGIITESGLKRLRELESDRTIKENAERHRLIVQAAMDGFWLADLEGRILEVNDAYCRMSGYGARELAAMRISDLEAEETAADTAAHIRKIVARGEDRFESRHRRKDGSEFDVEVSVQYRPAEGGQLVVFLRDITERKRAHELLKASEARFRAIIDISPVPMALNDDELRITFLNTAFSETYGYTREEIPTVEHWWPKAYPDPDYRSQVIAMWQTKLERAKRVGDGFSPLEVTVRCKDGTNKTVLASAASFTERFAGEHVVVLYDITERKQAEAALRKSEAMLSEVFRLVPQSIFWKDRHGAYLGCNDVFARSAGLSDPKSIVGKTDFDLPWPRVEAEAYIADDRLVMESGLPRRHIVEPLQRADGSRLWIDTTKVPLRGPDGQVSGVLGVFEDITERKHAEEELRKSEERFRLLFQRATDGIFLLSLDGKLVAVNESFARMHGYSEAEMLKLELKDLDTPETARLAPERLRRLLAGEHLTFTVEHYHKDGYTFPLEVSASLILHGSTALIQGFHRDISERRKAEAAIRLRGAALEAAANAIVITDRQGCMEWANPAFSTLSGYTLVEALGRNVHDLVCSGEHSPEFYQRMWDTIGAGHVWQGEIVNRRKDGVLRTEDMTITPLCDEQGKISHYIAIKQDITDYKTLAAQLLQAQRMEAIGALAGGIAHDLNNILAPITLVTGLLQGKLESEDDRELLALTHANAKRGAEIIRQLLTFSRGQAGERTVLQPRHLIGEMSRIMRETFPREITLHEDLPAVPWTIVADPTQLHQVLMNLCVNARDAMPNGGRLTVGATNVTLVAGDVKLPPRAKPGPHVIITVSDTGHGIAPEVRHRIFDPFFSTKPHGKGTGLGLSTVLGIVQGHGGFLEVESVPNGGSTFKAYFPAVPDRVEAVAEVRPPPAKLHSGGELILVVDDERGVREMTRALLEQQKYRVLTAGNGEEALVQYLGHRVDVKLVLTDLMMPVMGGVDLIRALRVLDPALRIIATSGLTEIIDDQKLAALGVSDVLKKPCEGAQLLEAISRRLTGN